MSDQGARRETSDVVIVGGGGAGLAAACAAAQLGARVMLLEKRNELGGNTAMSLASIPGAGTRFQEAAGIDDDPGRFEEDLLRQAGPECDRELVRRMAEISAELVHWLADDLGVGLSLATDFKHVGHSVHRLHSPSARDGRSLVETLATAARDLGVEIRTSASVTDLSRQDGEFAIAVSEERVASPLTAGAVVLGTDGFGGNPQMLREHLPQVSGMPYFGAAGNTGDGIRMAGSLGAATTRMSAYVTYATLAIPQASEPSSQTLLSWSIIEQGGIIVDRRGQRFANEERGYVDFTNAILEHTNGPTFVVIDQRIAAAVSSAEPRFASLCEREDSPVLPLEGGVDGLPDRGNLLATLDQVNRTIAGHERDPFGREFENREPLTPPYFVIPSTPGFVTTHGGLTVNRVGGVLDSAAQAVPGLFAAGGTVASLSGAEGADTGHVSGNGLLSALGLGMVAGRAAASFARGW